MSETSPAVAVVDADDSSRQAVAGALRGAGLTIEEFASADACWNRFDPARFGCVVADARLPGAGGVGLLRDLTRRYPGIPVVLLAREPDVRLAVEAMRAGATNFLVRPVETRELAETVRESLKGAAGRRIVFAQRDDLARRWTTLSQREREVAKQFVQGRTTREISESLGISSKTVDNHRAKVLLKMKLDNIFTLIRLLTLHGDLGP